MSNILAPLLLPVLFIAPGATGGEPLFEAPWRAFDTGDFPTFAPVAVSVGDLDADGVEDLVAAREFFGGPGLSVLIGRGDGTYETEVIYELPNNHDLGDVALADLDGDGDLDAVVSVPGNAGTDARIALYRNQGDGSFGPPQFFAAGPGPLGLAVADFTGDGFPDVMTADNGFIAGSNDTISLMRHNGQGGGGAGFLAPVRITVGDNSQRLAAADLDADGDVDIVVGRGSFDGRGGHGISVLLNGGAGNFGPPTDYDQLPDADRYSPAVALADMDGDGDLDLLSAGATNGNPSFGVITIRPNLGDGTFGEPVTRNAAPWTFTPHTIITADLDEDGRLDVVLSTPSGRANDGFNVFFGDGMGGVGIARRFCAAKQTFDLAAFDADRDGDVDILSVGNDSSVITVHRNPGNGIFFRPAHNNVGFITRDMVQGDLDRDGDLDLVTGGDDDVWVLLNRGDATFPPARHVNMPLAPRDILLADMNGDGWLDLVMREKNFAVAINDMNGGFFPAVVTATGASLPGEIGVFDLDGDGDLDVVATLFSEVRLFRNNGNGTSYTFMNIIADSAGSPFGIAGADLDHDGHVDLVFDNSLGISVYLGRGNFTVEDAIPTSDSGAPFVLADLDGDGELDLAYKRPEQSFGTVEVGTMLGFGDGGFGFPSVLPGPSGRESGFRIVDDVDVADLTGDGVPDVLFTNDAPNDVSVFAGVGDGTLLDQDRYGAGYIASSAALGDFDGDGRIDVAAVVALPPSGLNDTVVILRNRGTGGGGVTGDVNGDGTVNFEDLLAVLAAWGPCPKECPEDLDGDGTVGFADLLIVLANWT